MSRRMRLVWVAGLALAPLGFAASAVAQDSFAASVDDPGVVRIMPGSEETFDLAVHNDSDAAASLQVQALDVADDDQGCVRPEEQAGDTTCGAGGGELGAWLDLRLVEVGAAGDQALWSGTLDQLAAGTNVLDQVAGGSTTQLRLLVSLPLAATNDTMSDEVSFRLRSTLTGQPGQSTVLGVQQGTGGGGGTSLLGPLAATGTTVSLALVGVLVMLLVSGGLLVSYGRRESRTTDLGPWR
jgi:hypothetical protein